MKPILRLILLFLFIILLFHIVGCGYRCYPSKRSKDYAHLLPGTIMNEGHVKTNLVKVYRTAMGWKHFFVTEKNDTIIRYYNLKLELDCYMVAI